MSQRPSQQFANPNANPQQNIAPVQHTAPAPGPRIITIPIQAYMEEEDLPGGIGFDFDDEFIMGNPRDMIAAAEQGHIIHEQQF